MSNHLRIWILVLAVVVYVPLAGAAQSVQSGGQGAQPSGQVTSVNNPQAPEQQQVPSTSGEENSLVGVERFSPTEVSGTRSYILPSFQFSERADSNFRISSGPQRFETISSLVGRLSMQRVGRRWRTVTDYSGGALIYTNHSELNTTMHQFGITQYYTGRRWNFLLDDRAAYIPESRFGFGGFGWSGSLGMSLGGAFGTNLGGLNASFDPTSSILTGRGSRILNTVSTQIGYRLSRRSNLTLAGSYGVLHFRTAGYSNTRNSYFQAGYSRTLSPKDQVGISYGFGLFQYPGGVASFQTHYLRLSYGRRISSRMTASLEGGAQMGVFKNATAGSTTPVSWTAGTSVNYRARLANFSVNYNRYTTNGGGLLYGATTDYIYMGVSKGLGRNWSASLSPGFSRSRSLPQNTASSQGAVYDSASVGGSLSRRLGRYMSLFFSYNFQTQRYRSASCTTGNCGTTLLRHSINVGFDWHPRQIMVN
jgi:hypothetical protein